MKRVLSILLLVIATGLILLKCSPTEPQDDTTKMALVYPAGGETFSFGETKTISFKANGDSVSSIGVQVTSDGLNYFHIVNNSIPITTSGTNTYTLQWRVGNEMEYDTALLYPALEFADGADPIWTCKIKIYVYGSEHLFEQSEIFSVNLKSPLFLRYPIGGEGYNVTDTIPMISTFRTDLSYNIQYFFWSLKEGDWSQVVGVNEMFRRNDFKCTTSGKALVPADSSNFIFPLGDSTKIMIKDYNNISKESGWIKINKK